MRTTLDLDDTLLALAQERFPRGTPKTVILEEALRRLVQAGSSVPAPALPPRDPRLERLFAEGRMVRASRHGPPARGKGTLPLSRLVVDLSHDREDR